MIDFFRDMSDNHSLFWGLCAGLLAGLACGLVGPYVVTRRIVFLSGAIAHTAVGGVGAVLFLHHQAPGTQAWLSPVHGALAASLLAAVVIGLVHHRSRERLDTLIGAMWAVGMAFGLLLVRFTPGQNELFSFLFGNLSFVSAGDVAMIFVLDVIIVALVCACHKRLLALCLDEEYARLQGVNVLVTNLLLLSLVALTVVALMRVVGLILVIALLSLPAATAGHYTRRLGPMILLSVGLCLLLVTIPRAAVYGTRASPESTIVLAAGGLYLLSVCVRFGLSRRAGVKSENS
jgi:zinc transport system permease protein